MAQHTVQFFGTGNFNDTLPTEGQTKTVGDQFVWNGAGDAAYVDVFDSQSGAAEETIDETSSGQNLMAAIGLDGNYYESGSNLNVFDGYVLGSVLIKGFTF